MTTGVFPALLSDTASTSCMWPLNTFKIIYFYKFIYLFLAALGLRCCAQAFSSCGERGLLFVAVRGLLIAVASLVVEPSSRRAGFSSCGMWVQ